MKVDSVSFVSEGELAVALAVDAFTGGDIRCEAPLALRYGAFLARARWRHASTNEGREDIAINAHSLPSIAITHHGFAQRASRARPKRRVQIESNNGRRAGVFCVFAGKYRIA